MENVTELTWLGTAGFRIRSQGVDLLVDPYLRRNPGARPAPWLVPQDLSGAQAIFLSHGHFDHALDLPQVARATGAMVYASGGAARNLAAKGLPKRQLTAVESPEKTFALGPLRATAFFGGHVRFDLPLVIKSLWRSRGRLCGIMALGKSHPCGQVLCWRFELAGRVLLHLGSAGGSAAQLEAMARRPCQVLLAPLQGHSRIVEKALDLAAVIKPKIVVPHHFDDFYPPLSQWVDPAPFVQGARKRLPGCRVIVPRAGEPFEI